MPSSLKNLCVNELYKHYFEREDESETGDYIITSVNNAEIRYCKKRDKPYIEVEYNAYTDAYGNNGKRAFRTFHIFYLRFYFHQLHPTQLIHSCHMKKITHNFQDMYINHYIDVYFKLYETETETKNGIETISLYYYSTEYVTDKEDDIYETVFDEKEEEYKEEEGFYIDEDAFEQDEREDYQHLFNFINASNLDDDDEYDEYYIVDDEGNIFIFFH